MLLYPSIHFAEYHKSSNTVANNDDKNSLKILCWLLIDKVDKVSLMTAFFLHYPDQNTANEDVTNIEIKEKYILRVKRVVLGQTYACYVQSTRIKSQVYSKN